MFRATHEIRIKVQDMGGYGVDDHGSRWSLFVGNDPNGQVITKLEEPGSDKVKAEFKATHEIKYPDETVQVRATGKGKAVDAAGCEHSLFVPGVTRIEEPVDDLVDRSCSAAGKYDALYGLRESLMNLSSSKTITVQNDVDELDRLAGIANKLIGVLIQNQAEPERIENAGSGVPTVEPVACKDSDPNRVSVWVDVKLIRQALATCETAIDNTVECLNAELDRGDRAKARLVKTYEVELDEAKACRALLRNAMGWPSCEFEDDI